MKCLKPVDSLSPVPKRPMGIVLFWAAFVLACSSSCNLLKKAEEAAGGGGSTPESPSKDKPGKDPTQGNPGETPKTGARFEKTGSLQVARRFSAQVALDDGRILLIGGSDIGGYGFNSSEIYDPASGSFTLSGSLKKLWYGETATRLLTGDVLVIGGRIDNGGGFPLNRFEIYRARTGQFEDLGAQGVDRNLGQTATLLENGEVLIAGGMGSGCTSTTTTLRTAEIFSPVDESIWARFQMVRARSYASAIRLKDGRVLISGGYGCRHSAVFGWIAYPQGLSEIYNPNTATFSETGSMLKERARHKSLLLESGKVLVFGGVGEGSSDAAEIFDPHTGTFSVARGIRANTIYEASLLEGGDVFLLTNQGVEIYSPETEVSEKGPSMLQIRYSAAVATLSDGRVLVAGGGEEAPFEAELFVPR